MPMRIAFLCKRRYMGKDVIDDRYARLYEMPWQLARLGHQVTGFCLGYQGQAEIVTSHEASPGHLNWRASSLRSPYLGGLLRYPGHLLEQLRALDPDLLIGASDIPQVALTAWLAKRLGKPFMVDLYDNFEGFGQARVPGMKRLLRHATRQADLVTTTSEPLRQLVVENYAALGEVIALPSTVDLQVFKQQDQRLCRETLGLPIDASLIGTAGGLYPDKGIDALYLAWPELERRHPNLHLVVAGPHGDRLPPPSGARVHYLGQLPHQRIAQLFAALDVGVIYLRDTPFGRYCFPQKAYEMLACGLPVISAAVGAMQSLLGALPQALYRPDDHDDLIRAAEWQLAHKLRPEAAIKDWRSIIGELEPHLQALRRY